MRPSSGDFSSVNTFSTVRFNTNTTDNIVNTTVTLATNGINASGPMTPNPFVSFNVILNKTNNTILITPTFTGFVVGSNCNILFNIAAVN